MASKCTIIIIVRGEKLTKSDAFDEIMLGVF